MIRSYVATVIVTRKRQMRLVGTSADQVYEQLVRTHGRGVRVETITPETRTDASAPDLGLAARALARLLDTGFLPLDGMEATLREWLALTVEGPAADRDARNAALAPAGVRIRVDAPFRATGQAVWLLVGSARSIPFLGQAMQGSDFEGDALTTILSAVPGAVRAPVTMGGIRTRAVALPWDAVASASIMGDLA